MDEEKLPGSPDTDSDETSRIARQLHEEITSRKPYDHTWDVAVPGEEDLPLLPRPKGASSESGKDEGSEEQAHKEPEVLIQFENQEENLLSRYDNSDSYDNEDEYGYEDEYEYDDSYGYDESYEYEGSYDYEDPYGLNQLLQRRKVSTGSTENTGLLAPTDLHHVPPANYWMNNPPPRMIGSMRMPRFPGHMPVDQSPGSTGLSPYRASRTPVMMSALPTSGTSLIPTSASANPSPTAAEQSPQIQNMLNQASLHIQMQNSTYGTGYQDPLNPNYQAHLAYSTSSNVVGNYQDLVSIPTVPGETPEREPPGCDNDAYSPDDPTADETGVLESDGNQVGQMTPTFDVADIPTPRTPEISEPVVKTNPAEAAEIVDVPSDSPKTPKPVLGKVQAKKRLMAFANKYGVLPKVQTLKPKPKVDAAGGKPGIGSRQYTSDAVKTKTDKGKGKSKDKVKSLLEELNDAKLKIESALEAQQQNSSSGKSKKHHEDRVPAIEEIIREESMNKGMQDYNNPSSNAAKETSRRSSSRGKGRWKKSHHNQSDEENDHKSGSGKKFSERRRRYSKDRDRDRKSKDDKSSRDQSVHRQSQDKDPRKKEKEKSSSRDSRRRKGPSKERDQKDRQTPPLVRLSNEKEKDKEREREKEGEFLRCKNWLELKKSRLSLEEIVNRRKEDRLNKIRTAQDYAEHFDQMLMIGDHRLKRYPLIVDSQEGPREFPPESVRVTKRGRGPHVLYSENPRVSLLLNRQQLYQAVPSDRRDKMRQICEANNLQINPLEAVDAAQHQGWYESKEGTKSLKKALLLPATIVIAPLKSKWENGSPVVLLKEKKDSDVIAEYSSVRKDEIPGNEFKELPTIEQSKPATKQDDSLSPEFLAESQVKSHDRLPSLPANDVIPSPRSSRNREVKKHVSTTNKEARNSSQSLASVGDQKLVSEYEQFIKMVSNDVPVPLSTSDTMPSNDSVSSLSTQSKHNLKKSQVPSITASPKSGRIIEKSSSKDKSKYVEDSEMENADVLDNRKESNSTSEKKSKKPETQVAAEIELEAEADASSSKEEESDDSPSVPSDWENVKIKEEKSSDESLDKKHSRRKKKKQKSSSESSSSPSSSSESDDEEEEEEKEKRSRKNKKKNKRKLIRKKTKRKAKSSSESDSSDDQSSDSSSEDERRKKRRRKRKAKKRPKKVIIKKKRKRRMKTDSSSSDSDRKAKKKKKKDEKQLARKHSEKKAAENEEESSKSETTEVHKTNNKTISDRRGSFNEKRKVKEEKIDSKRGDVASKESRKNEKEVSDRKKSGRDWDYDDNSMAIEEEKESVGAEDKSSQRQDQVKKVTGRERKKERSQDKFLEEWENESMRMTQQIMHGEEISEADPNKKKGKSNKDKPTGDTARNQQEEKLKEKTKEAKLLEDWEKESILMTQQITQSDDLLKETSDRKRKINKSSSEWEEEEFGLTDSSNVPSISALERVDKRREHLTDEWEVDSLEETRDSNERKKSKYDKKIDKGIKYDKKTDTYIAIDKESVKDQRKRQNRLSAIRIWEEEEEEGEKEAMMLIKAKTKNEMKSKPKDKWETDHSGGKLRSEEEWRDSQQSEDPEKSCTKNWETESRDGVVAWTEKERDSETVKHKNRTEDQDENRLFEEYYQDRRETTDQNRDKNRGKLNENLKPEDWLILSTEEASTNKSYSIQADRYDESKNSSRRNWEDKDQEKTSDWEEAEEEKSTRSITRDVDKEVLGGWVEPFDIVEAHKLEPSKTVEKVLQKKKDVGEPRKDRKSRWDVEDKSKDQTAERESRKSESDNLLLIEWEEEHNEWVKSAASTYDELTVPPAFSRPASTSDDNLSKSSSVDKATKRSKKLDELSDSYDAKSSKTSDRAKRSAESRKLPKKSWTNEDEGGHNSLSSLIELNFTNVRTEAVTKESENSDQTSEVKSTARKSSKDNKDNLDLYSPSSPALSQRSEDMDISSGSDMDQPKEDVLISNIPLPSEEFPVMFGSQVASIPMPVSPGIQSSSVNSTSSIASSGTANALIVVEKLVPQSTRAEVKINDALVSPKVDYENAGAGLIGDKQPSKWESEESENLKKIIPEHSDKSSVSSSGAETGVDKTKAKNSMDIFADYESSSDSSEKTESENDLQNDYIQPGDIKKEEKVKSPLKLIPKQILFQQTSEAKSKSQIEAQKKEAEIIQGTISFKIQKKVLQTNVLPSDDNEDTIEELEKPRKQENQFLDKKLTSQKSVIGNAENSIPKNSQVQSDLMGKTVPTLKELDRKEDDKYNDFPIGKRDTDKTMRRSRSRTRSRSRSRSRSRDRRKKSPERRERDRWSREDRRRTRGIETRGRDKSGKRERLGTPTQDTRNRITTKYPERGDSRRRISPSKGRAGGRRNRSRSPVIRRRSNEQSRSRSPMTRRDRERSPSKRRGDGDKKIIKLDRLDEKDDKDFFKEDDMATNKFKTFEDRRERSLKSPIRYPVSTAGEDNSRKFGSVERKLDKERDRGRYRDSVERDKETIAYDPMEILREKGLEAERLRKRLQADSESRKHQWKYEGEDNGDEDDGRGLFPNEFDLDFEERCLGRGDSLDREATEGSIHSMPTFRSKPRERSPELRSHRSRERGRERDSPSSEGRDGRSSYSRSRSPPRSSHRGLVDRYKTSRKSRSRSPTPERNLRSAKRLHRSRSTSLVRVEADLPLNEACTTGRRIETIVQSVTTVTGITGVIADSTISDSELLGGAEFANNSNSNANEYYYYSEGNLTYPPRIEEPHQSSGPIGIGSPKRLSLDDRLELELGIKKKQQQIPLTVQDPQHVGYHPAAFSTNIATYPSIPPPVVPMLQQSPYQQPPPKVLQVGNVLQVIPSEFAGIPPPQRDLPAVGVPSSSHVVRVGNVLQVVPSTLDWAAGPPLSDTMSSAYHRPCPSVTPIGVPPPLPAALTLMPATTTSPIPVPRPEITPTAVQPVYNYEAILEERKKYRDERKRIREERRKEKNLRRTERRKRRADRLVKKNLTLRQQEGATFQLQHAPSPSPVPVLPGIDDEEDEEANSRDQSLPVCDDEQYQQTQQKPEGFEENVHESNENAAQEDSETKNDWLPLLPPPAKGILISPGFGRESLSNGNPGYLYEPEDDDVGLDQSEERERLDLSIDSEFALSEEQVESQLQAMIEESRTKDGSVAGRSRDEDKEVDVRRRRIVRRRSRKSVQFADGVRPGEGTSPSGGEGDMPSPPPPVSMSVLPLRNSNIMNHNNLRGSEKRIKIKKSKKKHQKAKPPKTKKKVKVKIIKLKKSRVPVPSPLTIEDSDELDDRSPPPPPPGSPPPPHLWPSYLATYNGVMNSSNPIIAESLPPPQALASPPPTPLPLLVPPPPLNYTIQPCNNKA